MARDQAERMEQSEPETTTRPESESTAATEQDHVAETAAQPAAEHAENEAPSPDTDPVAALEAERDALRDRMLRALAELENLRKRAERERREAETYGATRLARDLLAVHDNFERALDSITDEARAAAPGLVEGLELTRRELLAAFGRNKIHPLVPEKGARFDPKLHQAMFETPMPGTEAGTIVQVLSTGFTIGERLLRPAQVGVSAGSPPAETTGEDTGA